VSPDEENLVELFRDAAARRLALRVELAPAERNESRWLEGWYARLDGYLTHPEAVDTNSESRFRVQP